MRKLDTALLLGALAAVVATVAVLTTRDSTTPVTAQAVTKELNTVISPAGCGTTTAKLTSSTSAAILGTEWDFPQNSFVTVHAIAVSGCTFNRWSLDYAGQAIEVRENPRKIQLDVDITATAYFTGTPTTTPPPAPATCTRTTLGVAPNANPGLASDCNALLAAKATLKDDDTLNWDVDTSLLRWTGVEVTGTPGRIFKLELSYMKLSGTIPSGLGELTHLRKLTLGNNKLTGTIPAELGNLTQLHELHLQHNRLTGTIPSELGKLTDLRYLSLGHNQLSGSIPTSLDKMTKLTDLWLKNNRLTGGIPTELGSLTKLRALFLSDNQLTGTIPSQLGSLTKLTRLGLNNNKLTGAIPAEMENLTRLTTLFLAGNKLRGCLPAIWKGVAANDFTTLALPFCGRPLPYKIDTTGAVTKAGQYSFMSEAEDGTMSAVTTYEELRDGSTTALLIHTTDADGTSRATILDAVEAGDLMEWRKAEDCFVRYKVMEVKPDPAGTIPKKALDVEWMTYAFTGCTGMITSDVSATLAWGEFLDLGGESLTAPVVHGSYQIAPPGWTGALKVPEDIDPPGNTSFGDVQQASTATEAARFPYWKTPTMPTDWVLALAYIGGLGSPGYGYCSLWLTEPRVFHDDEPAEREWGAELCGSFDGDRHNELDAYWRPTSASGSSRGLKISETRVVAGRPALVQYSPRGPENIPHAFIHVWVYDPDTQAEYELHVLDPYLSVDAAIAIVASLFATGK